MKELRSSKKLLVEPVEFVAGVGRFNSPSSQCSMKFVDLVESSRDALPVGGVCLVGSRCGVRTVLQ